ncbi:hypothetical protein CH063_10099 [Colletotrichum higginsianum]|uniref:Uncharacterized protein n=1 Tax=Colletotrichum higginsianum (strain IMI 349063) TaxID=759273 RepID=H1VG66_COLHI|nr:hypothetical protein CH063_10099 [Colletotrichum higginsianum]
MWFQEHIFLLTIEREVSHRMILKVVSNAGQVDLHGDVQGFQDLSGADAGDLKQRRGLDAAGGENDLPVTRHRLVDPGGSR